MTTRRQEIFFSTSAVLIGLVVALVITEVLVRIVAPDWLTFRMQETRPDGVFTIGTDRDWPVIEIDEEFVSFVPNAIFSIEHFEYSNTATIDEYGGRLTRFFDDENIIPFLGDSFTFGVGVEDNETYINQLAKPGFGRFVNLGAPGIALNKELDILELRHKDLGQPDKYIFTFFAGNDFVDIYRHFTKVATKGSENNNEPSLLFRINRMIHQNPFTNRLYSVQFVRQKLLSLVNRDNPIHMNPVFLEARTDIPYLQDANPYLLKELRRLKRLAAKLGFDFFFIVIPDLHQISSPLMKLKAEYYGIDIENLDMSAPNQLLKRNFIDEGIRFIDITDCLSNDPSIDKLYYTHDTHLTPYGHAVAAQCLEQNGFQQLIQKSAN